MELAISQEMTEPISVPSHQTSLNAELLSTVCPESTLVKGTAEYERARATYWTGEQFRATPACIFQPKTAADVSTALIILQVADCSFAVKSGGHGKFHGESSISDGITIDLAMINHVQLVDNGSAVKLGPGNCWHDVYSALEPLGLTVVGGRAKTVGVGGFLLGGGISFFSNKYGWALDNIREYEVVLGNGSIVHASEVSHPNLYKALRGGGGNFGIVTSFTLDAYSYLGMWGGSLAWASSEGEAVMSAFLNAGDKGPEDPDGFFILALSKAGGQWYWGGWLSYCAPLSNPPIFHEALAIPSVRNETVIADQTEMVRVMAEDYPHHVENSLWVVCTKVDAHILRFWTDTWRAEMDCIEDVKGLKSQVAIQYITSNVVNRMHHRGGNGLGLADGGPFLMFNAEPLWHEAKDNPRVFTTLQTIFDKTKAEARRIGVDRSYIYLNYASQYQDAFGGFDEQAAAFQRRVSQEYDPKGVFQKLRGAGFKLRGAPESRVAPRI